MSRLLDGIGSLPTSIPARSSADAERRVCISAFYLRPSFSRRHAMKSNSKTTSTLIALACLFVLLPAAPAKALNPESPKVRAIVDKAVTYLRGEDGKSETRFGGMALRGMAILKATRNKKDPDVQAMAAKVAQIAKLPPDRLKSYDPMQYGLGIACMFLCALDANQYQTEIANLTEALALNQKSDGSWTYNANGSHGDTSQTQYGCMASWVAYKKAKVPVNPQVFEKAMTWLMRTQNQNGSFSYQPESRGERRASISLTAAGAGSILICAEALGLLEKSPARDVNSPLRKVTKAGVAGPVRTAIPKANVMASVGRANAYFDGNFSWNQDVSFYYFMYAMERYKTFLDISKGIEEGDNLEPEWYNQGVLLLEKQQSAKGSFIKTENGPVIGTSFAVLFLMRSTKMTFESTIEGLVRGGYGLPKDVSTLREGEDGEVIGTEIKGALDDVLALIEQGDDTDYELLVNKLADVKIEKVDPRKRDAQMELLRKKVTSPNFAERLVAVRALARDNNLDVAPGLIYALTDPDDRVAIEARNGLRFISRKFDGFRMPDEPNEAQKKAAQQAWKDWLRSIRPNAKFILQ